MAGTVKLRCPNLLCRMILAVPVDMRGQRVRCAGCGEVLQVPADAGKDAKAAKAPGVEEPKR